jgi:hypothetical protein
MLVSRRAWCRETGSPRSREASGSNPRFTAESNLQILSHALQARECGRAGNTLSGNPAEPFDSKRVRGVHGALQIPRRDSDHSHMANRVQSSTGSINARWRREPGSGDTDQPEPDTFRGFAETRRTAKSSTMKGAQALASQPQQRRSRIGKSQIRKDKGPLLYSCP